MMNSTSRALSLPTTRPLPLAAPSRALAPLLAVAATFAVPQVAAAQSVIVQAQSLFDQGQDLLKAGKIAEACTAFEASHKLEPVVTTLLNLADCRAKNGQLASAWGHFLEAERTARLAGDAKLARVAGKHAAKLKPRLSQLIIVVPADRQVPGLLLLRGNEQIDPATWNHALPVDGGPYQLTAKAPGHQPWSTSIHLKTEGDVQTIEVPAFNVDKRGSQAAATKETKVPGKSGRAPSSRTGQVTGSTTPEPAPAPESAPASEPEDESTDEAEAATVDQPPASAAKGPPAAPAASSATKRRSLALPLALGAGSLAFTAGAVAFKMSGDSLYDRAKAADTQQARESAYDSANTRRRVALALGGAAIACAGTAVYLYFRSGETRPSTTAWVPVASPQQAGLALVGSW